MKSSKDYFLGSEESFNSQTFGDLKVGEKYIVLPVPGDNEGMEDLSVLITFMKRLNL